jgi:phosphopantothenoylcysteine decarboxylase/phosphopantothenate--cysteine ligase
LKKFRFLICSGPTQEPLDPVRYLSNYSTGTMGKYLNEAARKHGHRVTWVQCPQDAQTARKLQVKLRDLLPKHDAFLMAAAVADARPAGFSKHKIKKNELKSIRLVKNPDVLAALSKKKKKNQVFIGFALETRDMFNNALRKLKEKNLEAIVLQKVTENETPFGDKNIGAFVLENKGNFSGFKSISKQKLAYFLIQKTERFLLAKQ